MTSWRPSAEEIHEAVVRAGVELLAVDGVAMGAERVSIERAAAYANVPRASAYRLWKDRAIKPQEAFQLDVLCFVAEHLAAGSDDELNATLAAVAAELERIGNIAALEPADRWHALLRVVRAGTAADLAALRSSPHWKVYAAVLASAGSREATTDESGESARLSEALRRGADHLARRYAPLFEELAKLFGLRLRNGYTLSQFATLVGCLIEGVALRAPFSATFDEVRGPYPDVPSWGLFGVGFLGLVREFYEPDPDSPHPTPIGEPVD